MSQGAAPNFPDATLELEDDAVKHLLCYLDRGTSSVDPDERSVRRLLKRFVPSVAKGPLRSAVTAAARPLAARRIERFERQKLLKLHLGSGLVYKDGWVNSTSKSI